MQCYPYSRKDVANQAIKKYTETLGQICSSGFQVDDSERYKNFMYHAYCIEKFSENINTEVLTIISNMVSSKTSEWNASHKAYVSETIYLFSQAGYRFSNRLACTWPEGGSFNLSFALHCIGLLRTGKIKELTTRISQGIEAPESIDTLELLEAMFVLAENNLTHLFSVSWESYLFQLLNRFEVTGKIYKRYTANFKKIENDFSSISNYALLAVNLLKLYQHGGNLKVLNAVLKLNDMLAFLIDRGVSCPPLPLVIYSFTQEEKEMRKIYDTQGFRLSVD